MTDRYSAIRYSGEVEVRVGFDRALDAYLGRVSDPYAIWRGRVSRGTRTSQPNSSAAYDEAAARLIRAADDWAVRTGRPLFEADRRLGRIRIRRTFQAPCPTKRA